MKKGDGLKFIATRRLSEGEPTQSDFNARSYDPELGRFTSRDPIPGALGMPQTLNPYAYGVGNPYRYPDPTGLSIFTDAADQLGEAAQSNFVTGELYRAGASIIESDCQIAICQMEESLHKYVGDYDTYLHHLGEIGVEVYKRKDYILMGTCVVVSFGSCVVLVGGAVIIDGVKQFAAVEYQSKPASKALADWGAETMLNAFDIGVGKAIRLGEPALGSGELRRELLEHSVLYPGMMLKSLLVEIRNATNER